MENKLDISINNQEIIDNINNKAIKILLELTDKHRENTYILNKINNYIHNMSICIENDYNNHIKKLEKRDRITELSKEFIDNYINSNNYFYCSTSEIFFKYDAYNYFTYRDDTILYEIAISINRDNFLQNYKHKIKNNIIREIKDRNIFDSIPDTYTIQLVVNNLLPLFLNNKIYVKYFLIILGDIIQKKNEQYTYLIDNTYKNLIKILSQLAYQYFGSNHFTNIKYGYHELQKNCRIIYADKNLLINKYSNTLDNLISNLKCKNSNNFLDVFIVGVYYSNRYENSDIYINSHECESKIKDNIMLLDNIDNLINQFISTNIEKANIEEKDNINITSKNMHYLWKQFILDNNLPSINFSNNFKTILKSQFNYNIESDVYQGITSKNLPLVSNFIDFWTNNIVYNTDNTDNITLETNLEISEIMFLFKYWLNNNQNNNQNINITENIIINLITHFFEHIVIEDDKFIYNIHCKLWNKNRNIIEFIKYYKKEFIVGDKNKKQYININTFYSNYCKWGKLLENKFIVGKCYFNKFITNYIDSYVLNNLFINVDYFLTI